ncbi:MAG: hypothetical protein LBU22_13075 [Dysgonamonadaceae bacterium]|nr:hypothetical protein [Dysgonamonadaceae bacterium]
MIYIFNRQQWTTQTKIISALPSNSSSGFRCGFGTFATWDRMRSVTVDTDYERTASDDRVISHNLIEMNKREQTR